jgi:hypothetical protein
LAINHAHQRGMNFILQPGALDAKILFDISPAVAHNEARFSGSLNRCFDFAPVVLCTAGLP